MEDKGTQTEREREREGRLLTGFGGPCPTAVSGPAAHPRISLRRGLLCGSGPADLLERLTDNGPGGGGLRERGWWGAVLRTSACIRRSSAGASFYFSRSIFFFLIYFFYPNREAHSHDVSVESRSACTETPF